MKNSINNIVIIGGSRTKSAFKSLSNKYQQVYHFKDELTYAKSFKTPPQILIIEESEKSTYILNQVKSNPCINVIYLSNNKGFGHAFLMIRKGVVDYILKDSFLNYSIQQSVKRAIALPSDLNLSTTKRFFIDTCALNKRYPVRFKLTKLLFF